MLTALGSYRRLIALLLAGALAVTLGGLHVRTASAAPPAPVEIRLDSISSATQAPSGTPDTSIPSVLAVADQELTVTVSFYDARGRAAYFSADTPIVVTSDRADVTSIDTVALQGRKSAVLTVRIPVPTNQVRLKVAFATTTTSDDDLASDGERFDVLSELRFDRSTANFRQGIGGSDNCTEATAAAPVCGVVILPLKPASSHVLLSLGPCEPDPEPGAALVSDYSGCGDDRGSVIQTLADLVGYTTTSPATILVKCDKTLCGNGAIQDHPLSYTLDGNAGLARASACPAKGSLGPEPACVDYVQSKRDGSGDTYLYLLLLRDARVSVG